MKKIAIIISAALLLASCSDWTKPEAINFDDGIKTSSEKELEGLRKFKARDRKVTIVTMNGTEAPLVSRKQHPMAMPDSAHYICIKNVTENLNATIVKEIAEVRTRKGTKSLCEVDYATFATRWNQIQDKRDEDGLPAQSDEEFTAFMKEQTAVVLAYAKKHGFDGVMALYTGTTVGSGAAGQRGYVDAINEWLTANPAKEIVINGNARQISDVNLLKKCSFVVIPATTNYSSSMMTAVIQRQCSSLPAETKGRILLGVNIPNDAYPQQDGYDPQPVVAARWTLETDNEYNRKGICVDNSYDDYGTESTFDIIRWAIAVMNNRKK